MLYYYRQKLSTSVLHYYARIECACNLFSLQTVLFWGKISSNLGGAMKDHCVYLDTYMLQQDMRVRLPKTVLYNLGLEKGKTKLDIYLDSKSCAIVLKVHEEEFVG